MKLPPPPPPYTHTHTNTTTTTTTITTTTTTTTTTTKVLTHARVHARAHTHESRYQQSLKATGCSLLKLLVDCYVISNLMKTALWSHRRCCSLNVSPFCHKSYVTW